MRSTITRLAYGIVLSFGTTASYSATPLPQFRGEASIPNSWPPNHPCAASEDGTVGLRLTPVSGSNQFNNIASVDLTGTGTLGVLDTLQLDAFGAGFRALRVSDGRAYLVPNLTVLDISNPTDLSVLGNAPGFGDVGSGVGNSMLAVQGTTIYVLEGGRNVGIYNCSDPSNIMQVATVQISGSRAALSIDTIGNDQLIIGRSFDGVTIHDSSTPGSLPVIGSVSGFQANSIDVNDELNLAYALRRDTSEIMLTSIDLSDTTNPVVLDQFSMDNLGLFENTGPIAVIGNDIVAVNVEYGRIELFDVSDPSNLIHMDPILEESENLSAAHTSSLLLSTRDGVAVYDFVSCAADWNNDGNLDFFDISAYLNAFNTGDASADFNGDGNLDFFDVSAFLSAFNAGCP